jgi:pyridoxine 5-phosphate synthase
MVKLSVNLNKFALLRNARGKNNPNIIEMAKRCIASGAHGITVHPRPDQRHAKYSDVTDLAKLLKGHKNIELNVEGNPIPAFLKVVEHVKPAQCTLVPDSANQLTSDHGWDLENQGEQLAPIIKRLQKLGIRVSLFLDPDISQMDYAKNIGANRIELYTESYADAFGTKSQDKVFLKYKKAAGYANNIGLGVNAGHDLNLKNLGLFITIPQILEVSIGHAIVVESFDYGFENTIKKYIEIIKKQC